MVPKMHTFGYSLFAVGRAWVSVSGSIPCQKKIIECGITAGKAPVVMRMRAGLTVVLSRNVDCTRCGTARGFGRFPPAVPQRSL